MDDKTAIINQMRNLISILRHHNHLYYVMGSSEILDEEYDQIRLRLIELENTYPEYVQADSPILTVGGKPESTYETKEHALPMLSLGNIFDYDELLRFILDIPTDDYTSVVLEPKFDGLAMSLTYRNGHLVQALTRGDGKVGEDVTNKVLQISNVPTFIHDVEALSTFEVRGEVIMTKAGFNSYNAQAVERGDKPFANPRNAAVGSLRQKSNDKPRPLAFYAYSMNQGIPSTVNSQEEALEVLRGMGFSVADTYVVSTPEHIQERYEAMIESRDSLPYEIDGMVIKVNSFDLQNKLGNKTNAPRWATAYKFPAKSITTTLDDVTWQVGRVGQLTPVGHVSTVPVGGVNISNVTLHNIAEIKRLGIMIGDTVTLTRAGDVIPKITKVWPELRPDTAKEITIPERCPSCDRDIIPIEGDTMVFCMAGLRCPKQQLGAIAHFASRECMDIDGLALNTIDVLIEEGFLLNISDIYSLYKQKDKLSKMEGFGEKSITKLLASIENSKQVSLQRFIYALGIRNVGEGTSIRLERFYKTLDNFMQATQKELEGIVDIGPITAAQIYQFLSQPANVTVVEDIIAAGVVVNPYQETVGQVKQKWCVTGSFNVTRSVIKKSLKARGITVTSGVSKDTDALLVGDNPSDSKLAQADKLNIPIVYRFGGN